MSIVRRPFSVNSSVYRDQTLNNLNTNITSSVPTINSTIAPQGIAGFLGYDPNTKLLYFSNGTAWIQITPNGVTSINANGGTHETGNITLDNGAGITIVDSPAGTFTFTNTGILSITGTANEITVTGSPNVILSIPNPFIPPGNVDVPGYLNAGSSSAPINTSTGMITGQGLSIGNNQVSFSGYPINFSQTVTSTGQSPAGLNSIVDLNPSGAVTTPYTGYNFFIQSDASNAQNFTSAFRGLAGGAFHQGTGIATMINGLLGQSGIQGASNVGSVSDSRAVVGNLVTNNYTNVAPQTIPLHRSVFANAPLINASSGGITVTEHIDFDTVAIATTNLTVTTGVRARLLPLGTGTNRYGIWFDNIGAGSENGIRWGTTIGTDVANWYYNGSNILQNDFDISSRHSLSNSTISALNIALGPGLNNNGVTPATFTVVGTDECHQFAVTTSSNNPSGSSVAWTFTYSKPFPNGSIVIIGPAIAVAASGTGPRDCYVVTNNTTEYVIMTGASAIANSTPITWNVIVKGY